MANILLVEDNPHNQTLFLTALRHGGHEVKLAEDGERALVLAWPTPELILLDLSLPRLDGWSVARAIREDPRPELARVPIIALTAHAMRGDRERALAAGCDDYLSKPISPRELLRRVAEILEQRRAA